MGRERLGTGGGVRLGHLQLRAGGDHPDPRAQVRGRADLESAVRRDDGPDKSGASQTSAILLHVLPDEDERTAIAAKYRSAPNFAVVSSSSHPTTERTGLVILAVCDIDGTSPTPSFSVFDTIDLDRR